MKEMSQDEMKGQLPFLGKGISQIALVVPDLDAAVENFWSLFGIGPWHYYTYGKPVLKKMSYRGKAGNYRMRIALAWIGALRIELIQQVEGQSVYADFVQAHGYGVHHLGVLVDDMASALKQAGAMGIPMTMDGAGFGQDGDGHYAYLDTEGRLGTTIELIERPKQRRKPEKIYPPEAGD